MQVCGSFILHIIPMTVYCVISTSSAMCTFSSEYISEHTVTSLNSYKKLSTEVFLALFRQSPVVFSTNEVDQINF